MSDYRCGICMQVYIEDLVGQDVYCQHSGMVHFQNSQFVAEDKVRDLERQLSEARGAIDLLRAARNGDATANLHFSMKCRDLESKLTAYQSAFGKVREALEFYADEKHYDDNGVCGKLIRTPDTVNGPAEWDWEQDRGYVATEALTLLSTLNAQDAPQPGQGGSK